MMKRIFVIYQRNQISMNLKYDVLGRSSLTEDKSETSTRRAVTVPMNLSVKLSISIKRVEYPRHHNRNVGKNVFNIWFITNRRIVSENMNFVLRLSVTVLLATSEISN